LFAREAAGAASTRLSLRPLSFKGDLKHSSGAICVATMRMRIWTPSLRGALATKQSMARHFAARWIASLALAMTALRVYSSSCPDLIRASIHFVTDFSK